MRFNLGSKKVITIVLLFATATIWYQLYPFSQQQKLIDETARTTLIASKTVLTAHKLIKNLEKNHDGKVFIANQNDFEIEVLKVIIGSKKTNNQ
jgi:hypothetical protein